VFTKIIVRDRKILYVSGIPIDCDWFKAIPLNDCCIIRVYEIKIKLGFSGLLLLLFLRRFITMLAPDTSRTFQSKLIVMKVYSYLRYSWDNASLVL
jgi:hypothetical protein